MYSSLWRVLPGNGLAKAIQALLLFAVVVYVCFQWVFPAIAPIVPFNENTVG